MSIILKGIDLPKKDGEIIKIALYNRNGKVEAYSNLQKNGEAIQIPKDHGRIIDGDYAKYNLENYGDLPSKYLHMDLVREAIEASPTILEAEE